MKIKLQIIVQVFLLTISVAQNNNVDLDSNHTNKIEYAFYPMAFYTPETQFAFGAGGIVFTKFGLEKNISPSKIQISSYYTTNSQYLFSAMPTLYFSGSAEIISNSKFVYSRELSKFYGVGNNTGNIKNPDYEIGLFRFYTELSYGTGIIENLHLGLIYEFTSNKILDKQKNYELITNKVIGSNGGNTSGLGIILSVDSRKNIFFPTESIYCKLRMIFMGRDWGSDFEYNRQVFDFRKYFNLGKENVLASQVYIESTSGDVPFFMLPTLGGSEKMRGYFLGRFRDEIYLTWQIEYRKIFWKRFGGVAFLGMGDVASKFNQLDLAQFKYAYGFGLRYVFDEKEKLNLRMDLGFGKSTSGIYFALEEAF
ncbi:MAG: outer membrane protein assembly factor [Bacteroidetes bacterium]|nr:outer membrane protein assembly factor [Bacteroidota bacterium]MBU1116711.1 outer membrane protein assembly factor [Bacteroidota bacterium]MBU1799827.1 outer membrane protein assembly factor [Bacteroidota bacterium]